MLLVGIISAGMIPFLFDMWQDSPPTAQDSFLILSMSEHTQVLFSWTLCQLSLLPQKPLPVSEHSREGGKEAGAAAIATPVSTVLSHSLCHLVFKDNEWLLGIPEQLPQAETVLTFISSSDSCPCLGWKNQKVDCKVLRKSQNPLKPQYQSSTVIEKVEVSILMFILTLCIYN